MYDEINNAVTHFLSANHACHLIEAVIDTSLLKVNGESSAQYLPFLNLSALNISQDNDLMATLREVADTENWGYLEDIVQEQDSSFFEISLLEIFPHWPDDLDNGNARIISILMSNAKLISPETVYLFHHIDSWPPLDLRTGKDLDISKAQ